MKSIITAYLYFHSQSGGVRRMVAVSESYFFGEVNPSGNNRPEHAPETIGLQTGATIKIQPPQYWS